MATKLRIEVLLTDADDDIIEFIQSDNTPKSAQFKRAMRSYMRRREEEQFDRRVKRLLNEVIAERGDSVSTKPVEVAKEKKKVGFNAKLG